MLYLFLVTVSDAQGLSYYSDQTLCRTLSWNQLRLTKARHELCVAELAAYKHPVYQVLTLDKEDSVSARPLAARQSLKRNEQPQSIAQLLGIDVKRKRNHD